ncbi:hypothetical protein BXZ70DRAFT_905439 [Cristinia sonorae]|uniref:Uncharacterized protein n=1 Tax=Cristinia sonorae TaxID=1940300 RepID=A0A8K0UUF4_9AGAR|nr:hypothetical protein BXZ70DRAFT_905439 [Cristinia sonorae]
MTDLREPERSWTLRPSDETVNLASGCFLLLRSLLQEQNPSVELPPPPPHSLYATIAIAKYGSDSQAARWRAAEAYQKQAFIAKSTAALRRYSQFRRVLGLSSKAAAEKWRLMTEEEKQVYNETSIEEDQTIRKLEQELSSLEGTLLADYDGAGNANNLTKDQQPPHPPLHSFSRFLKLNRLNAVQGSERWSVMSEEEKKVECLDDSPLEKCLESPDEVEGFQPRSLTSFESCKSVEKPCVAHVVTTAAGAKWRSMSKEEKALVCVSHTSRQANRPWSSITPDDRRLSLVLVFQILADTLMQNHQHQARIGWWPRSSWIGVTVQRQAENPNMVAGERWSEKIRLWGVAEDDFPNPSTTHTDPMGV